MNRRRTVCALGAFGICAGPLRALAQGQSGTARTQRIAWLSIGQIGPFGKAAFLKGLADRGRATGSDLVFEEPAFDRQSTRAVVEELVRERVDLIIASAGATRPVLEAVKARVPVAFMYSGDPVEARLAKSALAPQGNTTGVSLLALEFVAKRFELAREVLPSLRRMAVVANPLHAGAQAEFREASKAASALGIPISHFEVRTDSEVDNALARIAAERFDAVDFFPESLIKTNSPRNAKWSIAHRIPTISGWPIFVLAGNLLSYGSEIDDAYRTLADMALRILKGSKPGEMPIEYPKRTELAINLKAAKALGITIPGSILLRAHRVIE